MNIPATADVPMIAPTTTNSFLSERAQLEAARLARLKRMRGSEPPTETRKNVVSHHSLDDPFMSSDEGEVQGPPAKKSRLCVAATSNGYAKAASSSASLKPLPPIVQPVPSGSRLADAINGKQVATSVESDVYWTGELRQTANMHVPSSKDTRPTFRLHDILGNVSLAPCLLASDARLKEFTEIRAHPCSSFIVCDSAVVDILFPATNRPCSTGSSARCQRIGKRAQCATQLGPSYSRAKRRTRLHAHEGLYGSSRAIVPHKLTLYLELQFMLLFYKSGRMRVVISTANLVDYDWRDIENVCLIQQIRFY
jgi:tyrosyl-DNA phosphodiesterase 1